ncbi:MAG: hypothetical protein KAQ98_13245 [Bacteriovoracaceae bacterium]|nr:hypothetical protein [Bacteriovoracaceae bacterium]
MNKNKIFILIMMICISSCSTHDLKKSMAYSFLTGAMAGGSAGYLVAPEPQNNKRANALLFGAISGVVAAGAAYLFHTNDPLKSPLERRIWPSDEEKRNEKEKNKIPTYELDLGANHIKAQLKFKQEAIYKQTVKNLLPELRAIFPTPYIKVHKIEDQVIKTGNETILMRGCEAVVQYIEGPDTENERQGRGK